MCIHFIYWVSWSGPGWALTLVGLKWAGPENFRQKMGQAGPKKQWVGPGFLGPCRDSGKFIFL